MFLKDRQSIAEAKVKIYLQDSTLQIGTVLVGVDGQGNSAILSGHEDPVVLKVLSIFEVSYFCGSTSARHLG